MTRAKQRVLPVRVLVVATRPTVVPPATIPVAPLPGLLIRHLLLIHLLDPPPRQAAAVIPPGIHWEALALLPVATHPPPHLLTRLPRRHHRTLDLAQAPGIRQRQPQVEVVGTASVATPAAQEALSLDPLVVIPPLPRL